ncbi:hypothetical protein [Ramlibacter sp. AN1133]|uniref:hypothetical protein n=1 Tax=Ramlibacter sp. AN1133 TaxID=3133429 RepID=UPI0030C208D8
MPPTDLPSPTLPLAARAVAVALAVLASGCAHEVRDAVRPVATAPTCSGFLDEGRRCQVLVHADRMATSTSLVVVKGQRYQVQVAPGQKWCDAQRCSTPPHGDAGSAVMNLLRRFRRDDADWFTLMAAVVRDKEGRQRIGHGQPVETEPVVEVQHTGLLALYPNDVPGFYWNNRGDIVACIERLAPGAAPASPASASGAFCAP